MVSSDNVTLCADRVAMPLSWVLRDAIYQCENLISRKSVVDKEDSPAPAKKPADSKDAQDDVRRC